MREDMGAERPSGSGNEFTWYEQIISLTKYCPSFSFTFRTGTCGSKVEYLAISSSIFAVVDPAMESPLCEDVKLLRQSADGREVKDNIRSQFLAIRLYILAENTANLDGLQRIDTNREKVGIILKKA
jgi:hypothetical protein